MKGKIDNTEWEVKWIKDGSYELTTKKVISATEAYEILKAQEVEKIELKRRELIEQWHEEEAKVGLI